MLFFGLLVFIVVLIIAFKRPSSGSKKPLASIQDGSYVLNQSLLSQAELSFYRVLFKSLPDGVVIFAKVRIADVVNPRKGLERKQWSSLFLRISQKHFDFVLCDSNSMSILGVVELDDKSHNTKKVKERDSLVNDVCSSSNLPIYRIKAQSSYVIRELQQTFVNVKSDSTVSLP